MTANGKLMILKPDREENPTGESDQRLSSEITVHAVFHILSQTLQERTVTLRYQIDPTIRDLLIVQKDEDKIKQDHEHDRDTEKDREGVR